MLLATSDELILWPFHPDKKVPSLTKECLICKSFRGYLRAIDQLVVQLLLGLESIRFVSSDIAKFSAFQKLDAGIELGLSCHILHGILIPKNESINHVLH